MRMLVIVSFICIRRRIENDARQTKICSKNLMWKYYTNVINSCRHSIFRYRHHFEFVEDTFLAYTVICKVQCYVDLVCQAFL